MHIEVTPDGMATNIHIIGNSEVWNDKLHSGLLEWDYDKNIVDNIMIIFGNIGINIYYKISFSNKIIIFSFFLLLDISSFSKDLSLNSFKPESTECVIEEQICGICLCNELPDNAGVPQPLCQNSLCGVYFHRSCLFEVLNQFYLLNMDMVQQYN